MRMLLTVDIKEEVEVLQITDPGEIIPIHYNDYEYSTTSIRSAS